MTVLGNMYKGSASGRFKPKNPDKYDGDVNKIFYRSNLELDAFRWFDKHPSVIAWSSESKSIFYYYERPRKYIIDIWARIKQSDGSKQQFLIEVKPSNKLKPPKPQKRKTKRYLALVEEYNINQAKWREAKKYAKSHGMVFKVLTEKVVQR